jgi:protein required for attachment to host cells
MNTIWILVCDAARARLFEIRGADPAWHVVGTFDHAESRSKTSELVGNHSGQRSSQGRSVDHNTLAPSSSPKEIEKGHFVHMLATMLDRAMRSKRFDRWVLVAPPHFLGMLNHELTPELKKHLTRTVDKDLTYAGAPDLAERLRNIVHIQATNRHIVLPATKHVH